MEVTEALLNTAKTVKTCGVTTNRLYKQPIVRSTSQYDWHTTNPRSIIFRSKGGERVEHVRGLATVTALRMRQIDTDSAGTQVEEKPLRVLDLGPHWGLIFMGWELQI